MLAGVVCTLAVDPVHNPQGPSRPKAAAAAGHIEAAPQAQRAPVSAVDYVASWMQVSVHAHSIEVQLEVGIAKESTI